MNKLTFILLGTLLVLTACTTSSEEAVPQPDPSSTPHALREIIPVQPTASAEATTEPQVVEPTDASEPEPTVEDAESVNTGTVTDSVSPAEVDLSEVTSEPPEDTNPQVAPRPGVPDPKVATAHQASQDLAKRIGVDVSEVSLVGVEDVEWSDSSLGCPAPEMTYLPVITPGYVVTLEAAGEQYRYHSDQQGNYVLCGEDGQPATP